MAFLFEVALRTGDEALHARLVHTMRRICQGGIFDHLAGGFARYSVDAFWLVPHFEKMLYDNAQLLELLGEAWAITGDPLFETRAAETFAWLDAEMSIDGAFAASLDADSEGEEGRFYLWEQEEIRRLLGSDAALFERAYGVTRRGNFNGRNILNRLHEPGLADGETEDRLRRCRALLLDARARRPRPGRDEKILADWNGLAIAALARCGLRFDRRDWIARAERAFRAVCAQLAQDDRLFHAARAGLRSEAGLLDDYAQMARAALALHEVTGDPAFLERAVGWIDHASKTFADASGTWFLAEPDPTLPIRPRAAGDGATPSPLATVAAESARLFALTGATRHRDRAEAIFASVGSEVRNHPIAHASLLLAVLLFERPIRILLRGTPEGAGSRALLREIARTPIPGRVLALARPGAKGPAGFPLANASSTDAGSVAQVCVGTSCLAPAATPADLADRLQRAVSMAA